MVCVNVGCWLFLRWGLLVIDGFPFSFVEHECSKIFPLSECVVCMHGWALGACRIVHECAIFFVGWGGGCLLQ